MGRTDQQCSLCVAPENIRAFIESQVKARRKLKDLEFETGFDDSVISRHMRKCVPAREAREHRDLRRKINFAGRRYVVAWPDGHYSVQADERNPKDSGKTIPVTEVSDHDIVIGVSFEPAVSPRPLEPENPEPASKGNAIVAFSQQE
jgi:hypothetical protein